MADHKQTGDNRQAPIGEPKSMAATAGAQSMPDHSSARSAQDVKAQRGGVQEDQLSGETQKGAHNQEMRGANPQGNRPDQSHSTRREGDTF